MMRLIDADALEEEIRTKDIMGGLNYRSFIENAPTIEARRLEPCDDAISRECAKKQIGRWIGYIDQDMINRICMSLDALPPVTQKSGHWIEQIDHEENCRTLICSNCDRPALHDEDSIWKHKFCPHCGAKMVEPQESEG